MHREEAGEGAGIMRIIRVFTHMPAPLIDGLGHATWSSILPLS